MYVSAQLKQAQVREKCNAQSDDSVEKWFLWYKPPSFPPPPGAPQMAAVRKTHRL